MIDVDSLLRAGGAGLPWLLYRGDCLSMMKYVPDGSVDCVIADPPYFLSGGGSTCSSGERVSVDKGAWDATRPLEGMHAFNMAWLAECRRVLTPNGTLWVTGTRHNIFSVGFALHALEYKILNDITWDKVNPPPNLSCRYFTHGHEWVLWAARSAKSKWHFDYGLMKETNGGKQMKSIWPIKPPRKGEKRYGKHPAQKPEELMERLVLAATARGNVILDPFCGAGTTGVAAVRHGRNFIGIDLDDEDKWLAVAYRRMEDEANG